MELSRPWSLSLSYLRDRLTTYSDNPALMAIAGCAAGISATVFGVIFGGSIAEEVTKIFHLASSSASSSVHEIVLRIAFSLYNVRCSVTVHCWVLSLVATVAITIYLARDLVERISSSVDSIEAAKSAVYAVVADKFTNCPRCAHKMTCTFCNYEKLEVAGERALQDIGVDLFALQEEAALRTKARNYYTLSSIYEAFTRPRIEIADAEKPQQASMIADSQEAPNAA